MSAEQKRHRICAVEDVDPGERVIKTVSDREIGVFNVDGEFHAVANYCVHAGGPICEGRLSGMVTGNAGEWERDWECDGEILSCPWHGWEFDIDSGEFLADSRYQLITYETEIESGTVYVVLGNA
jgi:nitrite reductase/ring-hydroxylating ferredoxin subunit